MKKRCLFVLSITAILVLSGCRGGRRGSTSVDPTSENPTTLVPTTGGATSATSDTGTSVTSGTSATSATSGTASSTTGTLSTLTTITSTLTPTSAPSVGNYYDSISSSLTGDSLKSALYNLIKGHTKYSYDNLEIAMRTTDRNWEKSPNPSDENPYMNLLYLVNNDTKAHLWNENHGSFGSTVDGKYMWDKEHMWPKSNGFNTKSLEAYSDLHHLRASDMKNNNNRSNLPYGPGTGGKYVADANGDNSGFKSSSSYLPLERDRGDCARAIFYMATRYSTGDGSGGTSLGLTNGTDDSGGKWGYLSYLLQWNDDDPPDAWEIARNGLVQGIQGNRNPFIDHPEYARKIWG